MHILLCVLAVPTSVLLMKEINVMIINNWLPSDYAFVTVLLVAQFTFWFVVTSWVIS